MSYPARTQLTTLQTACIKHTVEDGWSGSKCRSTYSIPASTWFNQWLKSPVYVSALEDAKNVHREGVWNSIRAAGQRAADVVEEIMSDPMGKPSVRLQAAQTLLDRAGYSKADPGATAATPYQTREELVAALAAIPADVLVDALAKVREP